ncbi:glycoside hydrolase family 3 protein [Nocardia terpenica]|uniref:beta-N-acetylhexosaminidase n=1 Tax=Nocardia terpenica TaxID=455432 RepID=A0A164IRF8_9NOCA|nr:glycoside hydrolase family 3 N-terminal domain-containing protein [Nocardia terpenica]KZM69687.1 beta-glucosidase [Nocardia terpenica]MBF6062856.1 glycoside hydrolase family 3 protein [Nocardia terpenica]MBF6105009.1 glycoside hydrolase family 3 protein [Nocardia terpenica]MBF6112554.1 glycoside hydrolase family 3 protein [Nocardia terpenica]MBF6118737.1 glycoside hydrolase family 3 protein [Nocardia terpenica]
MRRVPGIVLAVVAVGLSACSGGGGSSGTSTSTAAGTSRSTAASASSTAAQQDCAAGYLAQFTTRQKLAQLLTVGVASAADAEDVVRTEQVGGIFVGSWTEPALLADKQIDRVKQAARAPLMVTIDEEGGRVSRLRNLIGEAPSARSAAQSMSTGEFYRQSLARAGAMKDLGITVDFAPDADVSDEPDDAVIGDRSFSDDPRVVTDYAGTFVKALHDAGLGAVIKHFPGHGHGSGDSHKGAVRTPPLDQLQQVDLVPFRNLVGSGAAVMVGHLDVPGLTTPDTPASISPQAMALLRQGSGYGAAPFDGPIFTDDLSGMAAITSRMGIEDAVAAALEAGADNALWISTTAVSKVLDRLEQEVATGKLPMPQVDRSVLRMARFKGIPLPC